MREVSPPETPNNTLPKFQNTQQIRKTLQLSDYEAVTNSMM
jgi:hypothetical protein